MNKKRTGNTFWKNPLAWACLLIVGYWLYSYHLEHAMGTLPYAILLLCPLMHIFMHHGKGHGGDGDHSNAEYHGEKGGQDAR